MRLLPVLVSLSVLLPVCAPALHAHGGQYRGPGGGIPPGLRDPYDPTPDPVPIPKPKPEVTPGPGGGAPSGAPSPVSPGVTPPSLPTGTGPGRRPSLTFESWMFWYEANKEGIEQLKEQIYARNISEDPLSVLAGARDPVGSTGGATQPTRTKLATHILPALRWAMDAANSRDDDVASTAFIALAKDTAEPADIERLRAGLARGAAARTPLVRECAALALGLLRRAEPARQFAAAELDRVRAHLFEVLEDGDEFAERARGYAALSLGLLGDQPTGRAGEEGSALEAGRATSLRLLEVLRRPHPGLDLPVALLLALGLQAREHVPQEALEALGEAALRGRVAGRDLAPVAASYAALALGRLGDVQAVKPLSLLLTGRSTDLHVRRSAAIALGVLGRQLGSAGRVELARTLSDAYGRVQDASTRSFALMSLAYLCAADQAEGRTGVLLEARTGALLLAEAESGSAMQRPYAALALGWILRAMGDTPSTEAFNDLRHSATQQLRAGLAAKDLEPRQRAAFAVGLGMARDTGARGALLGLVTDRRADKDLRGYAAVGLGLMGPGGSEVTQGLRALLAERGSEDLTQHAAVALGLVRDGGAVPQLLETLRSTETQHLKGQMILALARIGDARAVEPLIALLRDGAAGADTRALACAGLGVVGDLEWIPSLARVSRDLNYRAAVDLVKEVLTIL